MATEAYITGRQKYARPQAILWSDNFGSSASTTLQLAVPDGTEYTNFLILSDHGRGELSFGKQRIENRKRMINGTMRSYHVADKLTISIQWDNLPSRSFASDPNFDADGATLEYEYTVDGGAGGVELLDWYENHNGPFWMLLAYDKYNEFSGSREYLNQYNQLVQVYFSKFDYSVVKRGGTNFDLWNVSVELEEV